MEARAFQFSGRAAVSFLAGALVGALSAGICRADNSGVKFRTPEGMSCRITNEGCAIWRIVSAEDDGSFGNVGAVQSLARFMDEPDPGTRQRVSVRRKGGALVIGAKDGTRVEVRKEPFAISFFSDEGRLVRVLTRLERGIGRTVVGGCLEDGEVVYGLGQRLDGFARNGRTFHLFTADGYNDSNVSYMVIPLLVTSRGGGVFANSYARAVADIGLSDPSEWRMTVDDRRLDVYVFADPSAEAGAKHYQMLSGRPRCPEGWSEGPIVCRYVPDLTILEGITSSTLRGVRYLGVGIREMLSRYLEEGVRPTAFICEGWSADLHGKNGDETHALKSRMKTASDYLASQDVRFMIWMSCGSPISMRAPGFRSEYLVHAAIETNGVCSVSSTDQIPQIWANGDGNPDVQSGKAGRNVLDITNPEAWNWYVNVVWENLLDAGVRGVKVDFCEQFPDDGADYGGMRVAYAWKNPAVFANAPVHHAYPTFFISKLYRDLSTRLSGRGGFMVLARGGGIGSQRNPWMWAGDQLRLFEKLDDQLYAVLNSGISGVPFMTYDLGGYQYSAMRPRPVGVYDRKTGAVNLSRIVPVDGEETVNLRESANTSMETEAHIFVRGLEFTVFTGCLQTHGFVRNPYDFDDRTRAIWRKYVNVYRRLSSYRRLLSRRACETGVPPVRSLAAAYPDDPQVRMMGDEFLLGDALLVAPVLGREYSRKVYLPCGTWKDLRTGRVIRIPTGGSWREEDVPLGEIPVYLNVNSKDASLLPETDLLRVCGTERKGDGW